MTPHGRTFDPDALLAHAGWIRALARSLVPADAHLADDVAQDACLAALEEHPETDRPLGAWLAGVVKNLVRQHRRGAARRSDREERAARKEATPSTLDHVAALSLHRALVEAVMKLDEPYRETIVLRFFEELSPTEIARRCEIPVATVKTRLARGLEKLRAKLDCDHGGDGESWLLALVPLCKPAGGAPAATLGVLLVSTNLKIAIAATVIVTGIAVYFASRDSAPPERASVTEVAAAGVPALEAAGARGEPLTADVVHGERTAAIAIPTAQEAPAPPPAAAPVERLRGRVLDASAHPQGLVRVYFAAGTRMVSSSEFNVPRPEFDASSPSALTDAAGRFEMAAPATNGELAVSDERWTTVLASSCGPGSVESECVVVIAPRLLLRGRVSDESGRRLSGVRIEIRLPRNFRIAFPHILDNSSERGWIVDSDAQGEFEIDDAPRVEGAKMQVMLAGYETLSIPAPDMSDRALELVMKRPVSTPGMVSGRVLDDHGKPAAGARVGLGPTTLAVADETGAFTVEIPKDGPRERWIAVLAGHQPAIEVASAAIRSGRAEPGEFVELTLGPPPLVIAGRVVDDEDRPKGGLKVFVADPTFFGAADEVPAHVEGMLAGAASRADLEKALANAPEGVDPESIFKEWSTVFWTFVVTDAKGHFTLKGLLDRPYTIAVLDPESLLRVESEPINAGTLDASIRLPKSAYLENVRGRVVTASGQPVAGVLLMPNHDVITVQIDEHSRSTFDVGGKGAVSDANGAFVFERLPRNRVYLKVTGEHIVPTDWARGQAGGIEAAAGKKQDAIEIQVELRYHFQVEVDPSLGDQVRVVDAQGRELMIYIFEGNPRMQLDAVPLVAGRSKVMVVGEDARTLVISKGQEEVRRLPLELVQGQLTVVKL